MNEVERHERVTQLFLAACELPEEERALFLDEQCADDPVLKSDVEAMLRRDSRNPRFLETPALGEGFGIEQAEVAADSEQPHGPIPSRIGNFKILEVLGAGGMGIVFLAEQDNPRRRVALKVIRPGVFSDAVFKRFEQESHILGRLHHPGIAQVHDAGIADIDGSRRPYFAMEYVKGEPLTTYAETHDLGTRDRLLLMQKVCEAVHHAHQKSIIHRDLKPGNILVDESGQPKILDFGVARVTDADVQATTMRTDIGQLIGTISYMSPEQIEGDPDALDTRSDIYALGVICYRLLVGCLPYDLSNKVIHEVARVIRDEEPTPMSSVNRLFRGDVETIVHKALEKDRERRYQSASDFGADMGRYVRDEPIVARPASAAYHLRKFARRNRALAAALVAVFMVLVIGVTAMSWGLVKFNRQRHLAVSNLERARKAEELAIERLQEVETAKTEETRLRELADQRYKDADAARSAEREKRHKSIERIQQDIHRVQADQPELEASLYHEIGEGQRLLDHLDSAESYLIAAVELCQQAFGDEAEATLETLTTLANLRADQAGRIGQESPDDKRRSAARNAEALQLFRQVYETSVRTNGPEHPSTVARRGDVATMLPDVEAEPLHRENLASLRRTLGSTHRRTVSAHRNLARTLLVLGRIQEAIVEYKVVLAVREKLYPSDNERLLSVVGDLAICFERLGDYESAVEFKRRYVSGIRQARGDEDFQTLMRWQDLARLLGLAGRRARVEGDTVNASKMFEEAGQIYANVLELRRATLGSRDGNTLFTISMFGQLRQDQGEYAAAETLFKELIPGSEAELQADHWHRAYFKSNYASLLIDMKRYEDAEPLLLFAYPRLKELKGADFKYTKRALNRLVALYTGWGKPEEAARYRAMRSVESSE